MRCQCDQKPEGGRAQYLADDVEVNWDGRCGSRVGVNATCNVSLEVGFGRKQFFLRYSSTASSSRGCQYKGSIQ